MNGELNGFRHEITTRKEASSDGAANTTKPETNKAHNHRMPAEAVHTKPPESNPQAEADNIRLEDILNGASSKLRRYERTSEPDRRYRTWTANDQATEVCLETALRFACVSNLDLRPVLSAATRDRLNPKHLLRTSDGESRATSGRATPNPFRRQRTTSIQRKPGRAPATQPPSSLEDIDSTKDEHLSTMRSRSDMQPMFADEPVGNLLARLCASSERKPVDEYPKMCTPDPEYIVNGDTSGSKDDRYTSRREEEITDYFELVESKRGVRAPQKQKQSTRLWIRFRVPYWHPEYPYDV
jgi:hypothetical protein